MNIPEWKKQLITDLDLGIYYLPKAQVGTVTRCMEVSEEWGRTLVKDRKYTDYGFISSSYKTTKVMPGNYFFTIILKKNSSAVDISRLSVRPRECEVLFPRGQRFKIFAREVDGRSSDEHVPSSDELLKMTPEEKARHEGRVVNIYMYQI
jgi:hypothetical protein